MNKIHATNVVLARESRGLTQKELALRIGVSQGRVSKIEQGLLPAEDIIGPLSDVLGYPADFFYCNIKSYSSAFIHHRKRKSIPIKILNALNARVNIERFRFSQLISSIEYDVRVPCFELNEYGDASNVAKQVRHFYRLPCGPIESVVGVLQSAGIFIYEINFDTKQIDGFSFYADDMFPVVFVNKNTPIDRKRFTLSHELGHLVMHRDVLSNSTMEDEANEFASEFLMPKSDIYNNLLRINLEKAAHLKRQWKVSMAALIVRAGRLGAISENQYVYLMKKMSERGWKTNEPVILDETIEHVTIKKEMIDFYIEELGYTFKELCEVLIITKDDFDSIYQDRPNKLKLVR